MFLKVLFYITFFNYIVDNENSSETSRLLKRTVLSKFFTRSFDERIAIICRKQIEKFLYS